jgi:tight adherence protein B
MFKIFDFFAGATKGKKRALIILLYIFAVALFFVLFNNIVFSIFLAVFAYFLIAEVAMAITEKRKEKIEKQLIEFLMNMTIMLRSGKTLRDIVRQSVGCTSAPLKIYLKSLSDELDAGLSFDDAFDNFSEKCSNSEAELMVTALKINNKVGGNLVLILNNIVDTLQDNHKAKSNEKTMTLQARFSGNIIAAIPIAILTVMFIFMNSRINSFFLSRTGSIFMISGCLLEITGILVIRKILK